MLKLKLVALFFLFASNVKGQSQWEPEEDCCEEYCYTEDEEPYLFFGTKTSYDSLRRRSYSQQHLIPECRPIQVWSLNRHGTRLPKPSTITKLRGLERLHQQILRNHQELRSFPRKGRLCNQDYELFGRWRWNNSITEDRANSLTNQGIEDLKLLAARYKTKFPQILSGPYDERSYYFQYTDTDRTHDSYQAFIEGLFGNEAYRVHANTLGDEKVIKPYRDCREWEDKVENNPGTKDEYLRFTQTPDYQKMVKDVFRKLGFKYTLNATIIKDMYDMCRFEKAWQTTQRSPWCVAFTPNQLKLLEYAEDLKYYYKTGYGNPLSEKLGCAPLKDMYQRFDEAVVEGADTTKATFFFTHSATLQAFLTAMGVAKDYNPPRADNFYQQGGRRWRTSLLDPFAANFVAVLYKCTSEEKNKVMFFLNEAPIDFPDCSVGLCKWHVVKDKFQSIVENCNVETFCNGSGANSVIFSQILYLLIIPIVALRF